MLRTLPPERLQVPAYVAGVSTRHAVLTSTGSLDTGRILILPLNDSITLGRNPDCKAQFAEPSISGKHALISHEPAGYTLHDLRSLNGTFLNEQQVRRPKLLVNGDCLRLGVHTMLRFTWMEAGECEALTRLYERALFDPLTGLTNRHELDRRLDREIEAAERGRGALSVVLCDLDHFKLLNDKYGHLAGDAVLRSAAKELRLSVRPEDLVARFGGEEFVVVLRDASKQVAVEFAERMRQRIANMVERVQVADKSFTLSATASFGVATWGETTPGKNELLALADERLYRAKHQGRNRVCAEGFGGPTSVK